MFVFFFQAEDGIRDLTVTGVQTCALPILYLERFIRQARYIEVQILGDGQRVVHCFERECSLQRRRQKVWEEAPSAAISEATRAALCESALRLAHAVAYRGAGTLEYLDRKSVV